MHAASQHPLSFSHVLKAMGFDDQTANQCVRLSWCHLTPEVDWSAVAARIAELRG